MSTAWWGPTSAKSQFLRRLHRRVGHPFVLSFDPPFAFDSAGERWRNLHQLEAVVEFYANFTEPWGANQVPRKPGDPRYVTVKLGDPNGQAATVNGTTVTLDGNPDLSGVIVNPQLNPAVPGAPAPAPGYPPRLRWLYDTLWLEAETARRSRLFRIMRVDNGAKTVTVDAAPQLGEATTQWTLRRRPQIVIVDPFGARVRGGSTLSGVAAIVVGPDPQDAARTIVRLDGAQAVELQRVNTGFDTIHLADDSAESPDRPGAVYRVVGVDAGRREVTVVGSPDLNGAPSPWAIPAGVGGELPPLVYGLAPPANAAAIRRARGHDHYDGVLFLVHRDQVQHMFRWTSYTSRDHGPNPPFPAEDGDWRQSLSSLRGNARYCYSSYRSLASVFRNFSFAVIDPPIDNGQLVAPPWSPQFPLRDRVAAARFYFGTPTQAGGALEDRVAEDEGNPNDPDNGKSTIRLHRGNQTAAGSNSAGCLVSTEYNAMRAALITAFNQDYREFYGPPAATLDASVQHVLANNNAAVRWPANSGNPPNGPPPPPMAVALNHQLAAGWPDKLAGIAWLIRPDERPSVPPAFG